MTVHPLRIFLSYASEDKDAVMKLCKKLSLENFDVWFDTEKLLPGQDWDGEIRKAIRESDAVVICGSKQSFDKEGYVQKEIKIALSIAEEKPDGIIFIIPAKLEDCQIPDNLTRWQWVNLYENDGYSKLCKALQKRAETLLAGKRVDTNVKKNVTRFGGLEFVKVPAGGFLMGNHKNIGWDDEVPQHFVNINYDYWISRFPVMVFQYLNYLSETEFIYSNREIISKRLDFPITKTSWYDAFKYCQWLNKSFRTEFPFGYICRLPTEAEWEKAARGFDARIWPWGNEFSITCCNTSEGGEKSLSAPGKFSPHGDSVFGVADMAGNVWEWTSTLWETDNRLYKYPYEPNDGRENISAPKEFHRVIRGGSFFENKDMARCAYRYRYLPLFRSRILGFRVVLAPLRF